MAHDEAPDDPVSIVVSRRQYTEFLRFKEAMNSLQDVIEPGSRSTFQNDTEVAKFLAARFGKVPMRSLLDACTQKFGKRRTPSQQAAYRYWRKLRDARLFLSAVSDI